MRRNIHICLSINRKWYHSRKFIDRHVFIIERSSWSLSIQWILNELLICRNPFEIEKSIDQWIVFFALFMHVSLCMEEFWTNHSSSFFCCRSHNMFLVTHAVKHEYNRELKILKNFLYGSSEGIIDILIYIQAFVTGDISINATMVGYLKWT